jgi:hypothetical protein
MENYTETNQTGDLTNPQDSLNAALIFARALSFILQENQGIVVGLKNGLQIEDGVEKVIVFKHQEQIHIYKCEDEIEEGTAVMMSESPFESEEEKK